MPFDNTFEQELKNYLQTNYTFYTVFSKIYRFGEILCLLMLSYLLLLASF